MGVPEKKRRYVGLVGGVQDVPGKARMFQHIHQNLVTAERSVEPLQTNGPPMVTELQQYDLAD